MISQARWCHAKAEDATKKGHYSDAMQRHKEASEIMQTILNDVVREKTKESGRLQVSFKS